MDKSALCQDYAAVSNGEMSPLPPLTRKGEIYSRSPPFAFRRSASLERTTWQNGDTQPYTRTVVLRG